MRLFVKMWSHPVEEMGQTECSPCLGLSFQNTNKTHKSLINEQLKKIVPVWQILEGTFSTSVKLALNEYEPTEKPQSVCISKKQKQNIGNLQIHS